MLFKVTMENTCGNLTYFCKANDCSLEFHKHWGYQQVWTLPKLILFFGGNTAELYKEDYVFDSPHHISQDGQSLFYVSCFSFW